MSVHEIASEPVEIAAPAELVWSILVDLPSYGRWNPLNRRVESTLEIGSPVKLWISDPAVARAGDVFVHRLVAFEPPKHIAWEYRSDEPVAVRTRRDEYVTALGPERCTYYTTDRFDGPGAAALMEAYGASVAASFARLSQALRDYAEKKWRSGT